MKKTLSLLCSLVAIIFCISVLPNATAKAETEDYLQDIYYVELSESETALPVPNVPNGWAYTITLKDGTEVLGEKIIKYAFTKTGEYTLVYKLHKNGSLTDVIEETTTLIVSDTTSPDITTDGYDLEYYVGDTISILTAKVTDNVDKDLTATVKLYCGEQELTIVDGKYTFTSVGEYKIVYNSTDTAGNSASLEYKLSVVERPVDPNQKNNLILYIGIGAGVLVIVGAVIAVVLIKKNKNV